MSDLAKKFNKTFDIDGLKKDVEEAKKNGGQWKDVPYDTYEVAVDKLELGESKKGQPKLACWFKIVAGEYKGSRIFANFVIPEGWQIQNALNFLESLITENDRAGLNIYFEDYEQFESLLMDIAEYIDKQYEYSVRYYEEKGFPRFEIEQIYPLED